MSLKQWIQAQWYAPKSVLGILKPLSIVFGGLAGVRKWLYQRGWKASFAVDIPVIVVGNIAVGGTGKTPTVVWLAHQLKLRGLRPAIISRGYGAQTRGLQAVLANTTAKQVGDEALMLAQRTGCPLMIAADRVAAAEAIRRRYPMCNVIISDDGLQHYRLRRQFELVVIDSERGFGNGNLLPAGPLREPIARIQQADAIVLNGNTPVAGLPAVPSFVMQVMGEQFINLLTHQRVTVEYFAGKNVKALAGIGNPNRFFALLSALGITFESVVFDDHHDYTAQDLAALTCDVLLMTEKDAVKCTKFAEPHVWMLPVDAEINAGLTDLILQKIGITQANHG